MIRAVVDFALSHRLFMLAFGIFLFGLGIIQFQHLNIEAYPDVANNYAWIITQWPGQAAEEVERQVTIPIENGMNGIPYRTYLRSVTVAGLSVVIIWFEDKSDNFQNRQRVLEQLTMVTLPPGLQPGIGPDFSPVGHQSRLRRHGAQVPDGLDPGEAVQVGTQCGGLRGFRRSHA